MNARPPIFCWWVFLRQIAKVENIHAFKLKNQGDSVD